MDNVCCPQPLLLVILQYLEQQAISSLSEAAESRGVKAFSYSEILKIGFIVTVTNLAIYYLFITFVLGR